MLASASLFPLRLRVLARCNSATPSSRGTPGLGRWTNSAWPPQAEFGAATDDMAEVHYENEPFSCVDERGAVVSTPLVVLDK